MRYLLESNVRYSAVFLLAVLGMKLPLNLAQKTQKTQTLGQLILQLVR